MAILAWPAFEGGAALFGWFTAENVAVAGAGIVTGVGAGVAVNKLAKQGQSQAAAGSPDPCPTCKKGDEDRCKKLKSTMENKIDELNGKRDYGLRYNPNNQPWDFPGAKPGETVLGHLNLYNAMQGQLVKDMLEYEKKKCGPMPKGALAAAMKDAPLPTLGQ